MNHSDHKAIACMIKDSLLENNTMYTSQFVEQLAEFIEAKYDFDKAEFYKAAGVPMPNPTW